MITLPEAIKCDSDLLTWTLKMHSKRNDEIKKRRDDYDDIESKTRMRQVERLKLNEEIKDMKVEIQKLKGQRPEKYMRMKKRLSVTVTKMRSNLKPAKKELSEEK